MGPLQLPDAVDHVEERGDGEADDEHQHRDCRFKVYHAKVMLGMENKMDHARISDLSSSTSLIMGFSSER